MEMMNKQLFLHFLVFQSV